METDVIIIGLCMLLALCLILFLVIKNKRDRKQFEQDSNRSEIPPERHNDELRKR